MRAAPSANGKDALEHTEAHHGNPHYLGVEFVSNKKPAFNMEPDIFYMAFSQLVSDSRSKVMTLEIR
jgi:hypothetical protein